MTMKAMKGRLTKNFEAANCPISAEQFIILKIISLHEDMNQQECANHLMIEKSLFLRKIDTLQRNKLIARIPDERDKRKNLLVLTAKGADLYKECEIVERQTMNKLIAGVNKNDFEAFANVLEVIRINAMNNNNS